MIKLKLYWQYFKSTVVLNLASSVILAFMVMESLKVVPDTPPSFLMVYIRCCMLGGPIICFYQKEVTRKGVYYFYYNRGITKLKLILFTWGLYIVIGIILSIILHYGKLA